MVTKAFTRGDPCTRCGGTMRPLRVPTDEEYRRAFDRESGAGLPEGVDTASPEQRAEFGDLYRCVDCRMDYRFSPEPKPTQKRASTTNA
jgi:hypothetical protein